MLYVVRFNSALAAMNIAPTLFSGDDRSAAQTFGKQFGLTPHEAALVLVARAFGMGYPLEASVALAVQTWTRDRKIFPNKPEVEEALIALNLY